METASESSPAADASSGASDRCWQSWAMLIKLVYDVDPLWCPECRRQMAMVAFIRPDQVDVIENILSHCGCGGRWRREFHRQIRSAQRERF